MLRRASETAAEIGRRLSGLRRPSDGSTSRPERVVPEREEDRQEVTINATLREGVDVQAAVKIFEIKALRKVPVDDRNVMVVHLSPMEFESGVDIIALGDSDERPRLFFFTEGSVEVIIQTKTGEMKKIRDMQAPFYVGEGRVFQGGIATATIRTLEKSKGLVLDKKDCDLMASWGNEAVKLIEHDMQCRAMERQLTATQGGVFSGLKSDPLFMSAVLNYANRTCSATDLHFIFAVEELRKIEVALSTTAVEDEPQYASSVADAFGFDSESSIVEKFNDIWTTHFEPEDSSEQALARSLCIDISDVDLLQLKAAKANLAMPPLDTTAVEAVKAFYDDRVAICTENVLQNVIPKFLQSEEYSDFINQMFPLPSPRRKSFVKNVADISALAAAQDAARAAQPLSPPMSPEVPR